MTLYFAYGANMDPVHMAEHAPGARGAGAAVLEGHRFGIAALGFGTVRPDPAARVHGVLWELTDADLEALDRFEGVGDGAYRRAGARVRTPEGDQLDAMIYLPTDDAPGTPAPPYLERIIEVARMLEFPADYVAGLVAQRAS